MNDEKMRAAAVAEWERIINANPNQMGFMQWVADMMIAGRALAAIASSSAAGQGEPVAPEVLERLSYHQLERDDLTLDECLEVLANGYRKVRGRTDRQMILQLTALLAAAQPAPVGDAPAVELPPPYTAQVIAGEDRDLFTAEQMRAYATAAVEPYRRDAERYRWLRIKPTSAEAARIVNDSPDGMDASIDKERSNG